MADEQKPNRKKQIVTIQFWVGVALILMSLALVLVGELRHKGGATVAMLASMGTILVALSVAHNRKA